MTARVRITCREEISGRVYLHTAEADEFDDCVKRLREIREHDRPKPSAADASQYVGLGGLTEPQ